MSKKKLSAKSREKMAIAAAVEADKAAARHAESAKLRKHIRSKYLSL